jgi:hypothetical protein
MLYSCGSAEENKSGPDDINVDNDYYEFQTFDLSPHELAAHISLPDETANIGASKPEVIHGAQDIYWTINVGPNFQLFITDKGNYNDLVQVEKQDLADISNFKIEYLIDSSDMILYKRTLVVDGVEKASPKVGVNHVSYHVFGVKQIGGYNYSFESRAEGYEKDIIELMAKSIKSVKEKPVPAS